MTQAKPQQASACDPDLSYLRQNGEPSLSLCDSVGDRSCILSFFLYGTCCLWAIFDEQRCSDQTEAHRKSNKTRFLRFDLQF